MRPCTSGPLHVLWAVWLLFAGSAAVPTSSAVHAQEVFEFDVSEFEKKPFELRGYGELKPETGPGNKDGALYQAQFFGEAHPDYLSRLTGTLELDGRLRDDAATFSFRTHSQGVWDWDGLSGENALYEGFLAIQPKPSFTFDIGKKANRWGKGVAWNPVGFVERPKDPADPDLAREGFVIAGIDWIKTFEGDLQSVAITPLIVPTVGAINQDFGEEGHLNPAGKIYFLYRNTDIDLMFLANGARTARYGIDFSRNLAANFEIHGEFAYFTDIEKRLLTEDCRSAGTQVQDEYSYLVGLRYRTAADITYTLEYYRNGLGNSETQQRRFFNCMQEAWDTDDVALFDRLPVGEEGERGPFTRPNPMQRYINFKATWNQPFDILYFVPGVQVFYNVDDNSYSIAPEVIYEGVENLEVRLRGTFFGGGDSTDYGEKATEFRTELRLRYYF